MRNRRTNERRRRRPGLVTLRVDEHDGTVHPLVMVEAPLRKSSDFFTFVQDERSKGVTVLSEPFAHFLRPEQS